MTSINTNAGAMTALQTLKATSKALDVTQNRISTGYRVSEASHNAAYWSLATTMRSDNKAMSTVQDALGLGAAQVDVAYTAMDVVKDTLDEIKSKLTAASQPGVDKSKIQSEIAQLQKDLETYAKSATFSGGNWLDVKEFDAQKVVASFVRSDTGVALETIDINTKDIALFVNGTDSTQRGLLQSRIDLSTPAPDVSAYSAEAVEVAGEGDHDFTFQGFANLKWEEGDTVSFTVSDDDDNSAVYTATFDGTSWGAFTSDGEVNEDVTVTTEIQNGNLVVTIANADEDPIDIGISGFTSSRSSGPDVSSLTATTVEIAEDDPTEITVTGSGDVTWAAGDTFSFDVEIAGEDTVSVTGTYDGTAWSWATADGAELPAEVSVAFGDGEDLVVTLAAGYGTDEGDASVGNFATTSESEITVTNFDITKMSTEQIGALLSGVDNILGNVTAAASDLGAIKTRIGSQQDFVGKIMDAVDRGISQLVDADMEQESTRLQALQIQQQLGIQALSIANSNSQIILSLFR